MAAIVGSKELDLAGFRIHLYQRLPEYAHPLFLRLRSELEVTATFKYTKNQLVREGYNLAASQDAYYFNDRRSGAFVPLDEELYGRLQKGEVRL